MPVSAKAPARPRLGTRGRPEQTRATILRAAIRTFAEEGLAGARTEAIAHTAGVNKALLYYYFEDKDALYGAVLDEVFGGLAITVHAALALPLPPRERLLRFAGAHFDYITGNPMFPQIVHGEMTMAHHQKSKHFDRLIKQYFRPTFSRVTALVQEGMAKGEFRRVDPPHFVPLMISSIAVHLKNALLMKAITGIDMTTPEFLSGRRAAMLDFISAALFTKSAETNHKSLEVSRR
jgi:TetR/AcrR family transcriptional regulator